MTLDALQGLHGAQLEHAAGPLVEGDRLVNHFAVNVLHGGELLPDVGFRHSKTQADESIRDRRRAVAQEGHDTPRSHGEDEGRAEHDGEAARGRRLRATSGLALFHAGILRCRLPRWCTKTIMAFDEKLRARLEAALKKKKGIVEKRMFGGVAFMHNGKMALGVQGKDLMVKVGAEHYDAALERPHVRPMDFTGKPLKGYVYVAPPGFKTPAGLKGWIERGLVGAACGPPNKTRKKTASKKATPKRNSKKKAETQTKKAKASATARKKSAATRATKARLKKKPATKSGRRAAVQGRR